MNHCCDKFQEAVKEGVFYFYQPDQRYEIDGYDVIGDYPVNYCPFCGDKLK
jgi:hypothetical protein